jgi:hypothetical protein
VHLSERGVRAYRKWTIFEYKGAKLIGKIVLYFTGGWYN